MALPRISRPRIPRQRLTSPSARYGSSNVPYPTVQPAPYSGGGQVIKRYPWGETVGESRPYGPTSPAGPAALAGGPASYHTPGSASVGSQLPRVGGTLGGVPMVRTQEQPDPYAALSEAEMQARVKAQFDPLLARITGAFNARASQGSEAIRGITDALAQSLRGYQGSAQQIYSGAEQSQAASDSALAAMLSGQGGQLASQLGERLASINAPAATQGVQQAVTQAGAGAAGALYGKGSASLADLISRGAGAQEYAAKLPGIAGLAGQQQLAGFQTQLTGQEAEQIGQLRSQIPGVLADLRTTELQKADRRYQRGRDVISDQRYAQERKDKLAAAQRAARTNVTGTATGDKYIIDPKTGKAIGLNPNYVPPTVKTKAAPRPLVIGSTQTGWNVVDPQSGKVLAKMSGVTAPVKPTITGSSQTGWVARDASGKVLWTQEGAPAKPAATPRPTVVGSASTGWNVIDPVTGKTIATMPGAAPKPVVTGSAETGWTARDPQTGETLWTQKGKPPKQPEAPKVVGSSLASTSKYVFDTAGHNLGGNPNYAGPKPPPASEMKQGVAALAVSGGVDWNTGALSPTFRNALRNYVKATTGQDPGATPSVASPSDRAKLQKFLGVTPPRAATPKRVTPKVPSTSGKYAVTYNPDGTIKSKQLNPNYVPRAAKESLTVGQRAKFEAIAESFAAGAWSGGTDKDGNELPPLSYSEAVAEGQKESVPPEIMAKHLKKWYGHGNKEVQTFLSDPDLTFTLTGDGSVAALKDGKLVRTIKRGSPGYNTARQRAISRR